MVRRRLDSHFQAGLLAAWFLSGLQKAIIVNGLSIACLLLAGYAFAPVMRLWVCGLRWLMGWLFVFFALDGETGLINDNEGDIQGHLRRAAVAELVDAQR